MTITQVLILLFSLFALSRSLLRLRDKEISRFQFLFWAILWVGVIIITLLPDSVMSLSPLGVQVLAYMAIVVLFYLLFRIYVKVEKTNQDLTKLVRQLSKK